MFVRVLIVILVVLNLGVALWWWARPADVPSAAPVAAAPAGVATLQLAEPAAEAGDPPGAQPPAAAPAIAAAPAQEPAMESTQEPAKAADAPVPPPRCLSLGPFPAEADAQAALRRAGQQLEAAAVREERSADGGSYRVLMPAVGDRATAQAIVARIAAAGLRDYYVMPQGEGNSIALGQYRSREGAERRRAELQAKGFSAELLASGGPSRWWIDARTRATDAALRAASGTQRPRSLDCAAVR